MNKSKDKVLTLFIEIPNTLITELASRCEVFLQSFYTNDNQEDEVKSEDLISIKNGRGDNGSIGITKRSIAKQPKNSSNTSKKFFIQFSIVVALVISYFTSMFVIADLYLQKIEVVTKEMSIAADIEAHIHFIQNV